MTLSINQLENFLASGQLNFKDEEMINKLCLALNDWPKRLNYLSEFESELYKLIGNKLNFNTIEKYLFNIDYNSNAWEAESLSQLLEIFDYFERDIELKNIFKEINGLLNNP